MEHKPLRRGPNVSNEEAHRIATTLWQTEPVQQEILGRSLLALSESDLKSEATLPDGRSVVEDAFERFAETVRLTTMRR